MKILVTGAGGYIGSVLVPKLLKNNYKVIAVDEFYFGEDKLDTHPNLQIIKMDVRNFDSEILKGIDSIIDLVAISNDPGGEYYKDETLAVNFESRVNLARLAKEHGVKRYILPSSCSIYGFHPDGVIVDETSSINPLSTYAKANRMAEEGVLKLAEETFCVTVMRQSTIYGSSKRMRFDLAVNAMVYEIWKNGKLPLMRDGKQWRPFLHIDDTTDCMMYLLNVEQSKINGEIFNIGSDDENYQIVNLANLIKSKVNPDATIEWYGDPDNRSYRVDFKKITNVTGWKTKKTVAEGAIEIMNDLVNKKIDKTEQTITLNWYKKVGYKK